MQAQLTPHDACNVVARAPVHHDWSVAMQLLTATDLARILGRSPHTIRADVHRNPGALPPRLDVPGTRLLRWRRVDVEHWISCLKTSDKRGHS